MTDTRGALGRRRGTRMSTRPMPTLAIALLFSSGLLAGCGGDDGSTASASTTASETSASESSGEEPAMTDAMWAAMMIPHHQMGIEMAQMAVEKAVTPGVREVAQTAAEEQQAQLATLQEIAEAGGEEPMPPEAPLEAFNMEDMAELEALSAEEFDRTWLDTFRSHHMAAIMMTDVAMAGTAGGEAEALQMEIHDGQLEETQTMNELSQQLG